MHGDNKEIISQSQPTGELTVIGMKADLGTVQPFRGGKRLIGRHGNAVAFLRYRVGRSEGSVAINKKPRIAAQKRRCAQYPGETTGYSGGADIPGNVLLKTLRRKAKRSPTWRQSIAGMIAQQQERRVQPAFNRLERFNLLIRLMSIWHNFAA